MMDGVSTADNGNIMNMSVENKGVSLRLHGAVLVAILFEGAFGAHLGFHLSSLMVWVPVCIILLHSLSSMLQNREALVSTSEINPLIIALYFLVMWRLVVTFWSAFGYVSFKENGKTLFLFVYVMSLLYIMKRTSKERLLKMVAYVVTLGLLFSALSYFYQLVTEGGLANYGVRMFKLRLKLFYVGNTAGAVILILGLWNWTLVFSQRYLRIGLFNAFLAFILLLGITSQASLGGYMASISIVLLYYFYSIRKKMLLLYISSISSVLLLVYSIYYVVMSTKIETISTLNGRIGIWLNALEVIKEGKWLTGVGSGVSYLLTSESNRGPTLVHNMFINAVASGGILELALIVFICAWVVKMALANSGKRGIVLLAYIVGALVRNQAESAAFLFGYLSNSWVFMSWYALISIIVLVKGGAFHKDKSITET